MATDFCELDVFQLLFRLNKENITTEEIKKI